MENKSKSILRAKVSNTKGNKDAINVCNNSTDKLGRMLSDRHYYKFKTWFGTVNSIRSYMDYISTKDYPEHLLRKIHLDKEDIELVSKLEKVRVPNYWALVLMGLIDKVKGDESLRNMIKENTKGYTSRQETKKTELFGRTIELSTIPKKSSIYLACIRVVDEMVKSGDIDDPAKVEQIVKESADDPTVDLLEGVPFVEKTETASQESSE